MTMTPRLAILTACLLAGNFGIRLASRTPVSPAATIARLPMAIGDWRGENLPPLEPRVRDLLRVDEYVNRVYRSDRGEFALYIGYYRSQQQGDTIHSPLNCLPGSGWSPVSKTALTIPLNGADPSGPSIAVNRYVVQKGLERQVVLYWYQAHGRVVANEYLSRLYLIYDAVRLNRSDAAVVRINSRAETTRAASAGGTGDVDFVKALFPVLVKYLPS